MYRGLQKEKEKENSKAKQYLLIHVTLNSVTYFEVKLVCVSWVDTRTKTVQGPLDCLK